MERKYQVFVSSTYDDLTEERQEVMRALLELDCIPSGMELFPATDEETWTLIKNVIDNCDYYVVVVGGRYGSIGPAGISYTQMEYEYALSQNKPIIAFLHKDPGLIQSSKSEQSEEKRNKLREFRSMLERKPCKYWTTPSELSSVISRSLVKLIRSRPAIGWVRADNVPDQSASQTILLLSRRIIELEEKLKRYQEIDKKLKTSRIVKAYRQPAFLLGPRAVGKTSLLMLWNHSHQINHVTASATSIVSEIPVYDFPSPLLESHFANPEIIVPVQNHLLLKVYDSPGEIAFQRRIREFLIEETRRVREETQKDLGVVLVCMFDAEEAHIGLRTETQEYYNGKLFKEICELATTSQVNIERVVVAFNKYDLLKKHFPTGESYSSMLKLCVENFTPVSSLLSTICEPERISQVLISMVEEGEIGPQKVLAEVCRDFIGAFAV